MTLCNRSLTLPLLFGLFTLLFACTEGAKSDQPLMEEVSWKCGDPLNYQGYEYATVPIGEQCWFAENLRSVNYANGDSIHSKLTDSEWTSTRSGAFAIYGEGNSPCNDPYDLGACGRGSAEYGHLYNWYAVNDARSLCPAGWHVPSDEEWMTMEIAVGMSEGDAARMWFGGILTYDGYGALNDYDSLRVTRNVTMKGDYWRDERRLEQSGFSGEPGGIRSWQGGGFEGLGDQGMWWTSTGHDNGSAGQIAWLRGLHEIPSDTLSNNVTRILYDGRAGLSVRCIKDAE